MSVPALPSDIFILYRQISKNRSINNIAMKQPKLTIPAMAALLMAALAACSGDDDQLVEFEGSPLEKEYTLSVETAKGIGAVVGDLQSTTRALTQSGSTLTASWATTDRVYVQNGGAWAIGSLQPQTAGATATLKGSLTGVTIAVDDVLTLQFPKSGTPDYSGQKGTLEDIAANYDYATATATVRAVSANGMVAADATTFTNQQAIVRFTLLDAADGTTPVNATNLTVSDGTNTYTVNPAAATNDLYIAIPGFSGRTVTLKATTDLSFYKFEKTAVTFTNGQYYEVTVKMEEPTWSDVPGTLPGMFSVSASKKVWFSQGNLQYIGSAATPYWQFATNQWDYLGTSTGQNSSATNVDRDLFGWGTGSNPNEITMDNSYYSSYNEWGTHMGSGWATLTTDEWQYLFANHTYGLATVNSVHGVIILPDSYSGTAVTAGYGSGWNTNTPDASTWTAMEAAGAVFLPAAGYREGTEVKTGSNGGYGSYWSSTAGGDYTTACRVYFRYNSLGADGNYYRYRGMSVRLVRNAN